MKYSISINQIMLSQTNLDIKDALIIDYLKAFCMANDRKIKQLIIAENGIDYRYTWINFKHLINEMPLLGIKQKASISERIKKIEKEGFIKTFRAPNRDIYIRLKSKIKELEFSKIKNKGVSLNKQGVSLNKQGCSSKLTGVLVKTNSTNKDINNKDINNKDINNNIALREKSRGGEVIPNLLNDKQKHIQIIGLFAKAKKITFMSKEHQESFIKRNLRAASLLKPYPLEKIINTMAYLMQKADFKFTLETIGKYIDEDLNNLNNLNGKIYDLSNL